MYLLDTNVISELRKEHAGRADGNVVAWARSVARESLFISVMTLYELEMGILRITRKDKVQGDTFRAWLESQVIPSFQNHTLPISSEIALCCAGLHVPDPKPERDAMIAATAMIHNMILVTRNEKDFSGMSVKLLNPWNARA